MGNGRHLSYAPRKDWPESPRPKWIKFPKYAPTGNDVIDLQAFQEMVTRPQQLPPPVIVTLEMQISTWSNWSGSAALRLRAQRYCQGTRSGTASAESKGASMDGGLS